MTIKTLSDRVHESNNQFLEDARSYFLEDFLDSAYKGKKKDAIRRWLKNSDSKTILLRQIDTEDRPDFVSDPLIIHLWADRFEMRLTDKSGDIAADVVMNATHEAIVTATGSLKAFIEAVVAKKIRLPKLWRHVRDHYYTARLFFG